MQLSCNKQMELVSRLPHSKMWSTLAHRTLHLKFTMLNQMMFTCWVTHQEQLEIQKVSNSSTKWSFNAQKLQIVRWAIRNWLEKIFTSHTCQQLTPLNKLCKRFLPWLVCGLDFMVVIHSSLLLRTCQHSDQLSSHQFQEFSIASSEKSKTLLNRQLDAKHGLSIVLYQQNLLP